MISQEERCGVAAVRGRVKAERPHRAMVRGAWTGRLEEAQAEVGMGEDRGVEAPEEQGAVKETVVRAEGQGGLSCSGQMSPGHGEGPGSRKVVRGTTFCIGRRKTMRSR